VPVRQRDIRSYVDVVNQINMQSQKVDQSQKQNQKVKQQPTANHEDKELVNHDSKEVEIKWHHNSLVGWILKGVDYSMIRKRLIKHEIDFSGIRFLGATKALIVFDRYDKMLEALDIDTQLWNEFFTEVRPWLQTDSATIDI